MVRDGYFYGAGCLLAAMIVAWLAAWPYAVPLLLLAAFFLWFFRDPERQIPTLPGAVVSPGDGKVTDVSLSTTGGTSRHRISVFLSVFDVHVNRSPIAGVIARRIVFNFKVGDHVARGQRVGLIKFGSRVDVLFDRDAAIQVKPGDRVKGGASVLALLPVAQPVSAGTAAEREAHRL